MQTGNAHALLWSNVHAGKRFRCVGPSSSSMFVLYVLQARLVARRCCSSLYVCVHRSGV